MVLYKIPSKSKILLAVVKAVRKASRSDMIPVIIIATLKTRQDKQAVMRHKRNLRNS